MPDKNPPCFKGAIWFGLVFLLAGGAVMMQALRVDAAEMNAPRWVGFAFGLVFFNAGLTVSLMDSIFNAYRESKFFSYLHALALLSIFLIFPLLFNWVAFGPGEREFSMGISIPFLSFDSGGGNEIIGRIAFGIPALLMDAVIGYVLFAFIVEANEKKKDKALSAYIEEMDSEE